MDNSARREKILQLLQGSPSPITGTALAKACDVSRQIIVGDVALMRAQGTDIISTPRGYQLVTPVVPGCTRVFVCCHGLDQMEGELNASLDNGGTGRNVVIEHAVDGHLELTWNHHSRRDVPQFVVLKHDSPAASITAICGGPHTNLVEGATEA